jgi:uncharacterized DUF497 family protein
MKNAVHGFDWDDANRGKCQKHGVSVDDIEYVFKNNPMIFPDLKHSLAEERHVAVGVDSALRHTAVVFTYRNGCIRPISARYMHRKEIKRFKTL